MHATQNGREDDHFPQRMEQRMITDHRGWRRGCTEQRMITDHRGWKRGCSTLWMEERTKKRMSPKRTEEKLVNTEEEKERLVPKEERKGQRRE